MITVRCCDTWPLNMAYLHCDLSFKSATYLLLTRQVLMEITRDKLPKDFQCSVEARLYSDRVGAHVHAHVPVAL